MRRCLPRYGGWLLWGGLLASSLGQLPFASAQSREPAGLPPAAEAPSLTPGGEPPPQGYLPDGTQVSDRVAAARELFSSGQYGEAATILSLVITVEPRPIHLFNLGQSQRRAGQIEAARKSYQTFIAVAPQHPNVAEARTYIRELDQIAGQVAQAEKEYRRQLDRTRGDLLRQLDSTRGELLTERAQVAALRRPLYKRAWFWVALSGALTAATVGAVVAAVLATRPPEPPPTDTGYIGFPF